MALILADRVKESTTTTGTSDFALGGAITGFQTFAAAVGANNTTYYAIADGADWEVGLGTLSGDGLTLARTTVFQSSNSDSKVSFASGTKQLFVTYAADKAVFEDASGNVTLPANLTVTGGSTTDSVQLDLTAGVTPAVGQIAWDSAQGTASLGLLGGNIISRLGQSLVAYVTNAESVTITKGQAVYLFSAQGDRATVKLAYNTGDATSAKTLGIVGEDITANGTGFVICQGVAYGLNLAAYTAGDTLYLGATAGSLTATKPYAPNHLVYMGVVEKANSGAGQLYVRVQNGYELDELHNVSAQSPTSGQQLVYNASTGLWEKSNAPVISGGSIDNAPIGATTQNTGNFSTLKENSVAVVTQSDIGSAPNEIPLNQYLGSLAYQNGDAYYNTGMTVGFRNRIINGAMVIDQRNAGASVTITTNGVYALDRWQMGSQTSSAYSVQQSTNAPTGFPNSLLITSLAATSITSGSYYSVLQAIEGFNSADLAFGTSNARTITISFWVRSSLTGTFGGWIQNANVDRSYPFSYTISTANNWEQKTVTIAGDTTGTWVGGTNGAGLYVGFSLGMGSVRQGSPNAWQSGNYRSVIGETPVVGTNGATFYITGVQLEKGNIATSFDVRPYGTELALCQRYYQQIQTSNVNERALIGNAYNAVAQTFLYNFQVTMRAAPTVTVPNLGQVLNEAVAWYTPTGYSISASGPNFASIQTTLSTSTFTTNNFAWWGQQNSGALILKVTASAEL